MNTTLKALLIGSAFALATVAGIEAIAAPSHPIVKLETVVVSAKRLPVQTDVIKLDTVLVTATIAQAIAAAAEANSKQAAAAMPNQI